MNINMKSILEKWQVKEEHFWTCFGRSDNGIDHSEAVVEFSELKEENVVLEESNPIGYEIMGKVLRFDFYEEDKVKGPVKEDFVGGWGDITKYTEYSLVKK